MARALQKGRKQRSSLSPTTFAHTFPHGKKPRKHTFLEGYICTTKLPVLSPEPPKVTPSTTPVLHLCYKKTSSEPRPLRSYSFHYRLQTSKRLPVPVLQSCQFAARSSQNLVQHYICTTKVLVPNISCETASKLNTCLIQVEHFGDRCPQIDVLSCQRFEIFRQP